MRTLSVTFTSIITYDFKKVQPPFLKPGDEIVIVSPAFAIEESVISSAVALLEGWGLKVHLGRNALKQNGPFAGTDNERVSDFQAVTGNKKIKAVLCSRGGYGMLKIINRIDFTDLRRYPKWYVGFSDITVLLNGLSALLIGGLNKMEDTRTPWGKSAEATIADVVAGFDYPVLFNFPAGHITDNRALYTGEKAKINIKGNNATLVFL